MIREIRISSSNLFFAMPVFPAAALRLKKFCFQFTAESASSRPQKNSCERERERFDSSHAEQPVGPPAR
jgi:hypothetical protein